MVKVVSGTTVVSVGVLEFPKVVEGIDLFEGDLYEEKEDEESHVEFQTE